MLRKATQGVPPSEGRTRTVSAIIGDVLQPFLILVVVAGWAAYLLPLWVHRHDAASEMKSIQGFSTAMRTLSRRTTTTVDGRYVMMPRPTGAAPTAVHVSGAGVRRAEEERMTRRRQIMVGLLATFALSLPLAMLVGGRTRLAPGLALLAVVAYASVLRRDAVREAERRRRARKAALQRRFDEERRAYEERAAASRARAVPGAPAARRPVTAYTDHEPVLDSRRAVGQ